MKYRTLLLFTFIIALFSCKDKAMESVVENVDNGSEYANGECSGFSDFPNIPGWSHEEIVIPNSFNRSWKPFFIDKENGFLYGSDGELLRTSDEGNTWETVHNFGELSYGEMYFLDENQGFLSALDRNAGGENLIGGALLKTSDGGETWTKHDYSPQGTLSQIVFLNENKGFASFSQIYLNSSGETTSFLAKTEDGGATWTPIDDIVPASSIHNTLQINTDGFGYFGGDGGIVYLTHDSGATWEGVETGLDRLSRVQFLDDLNGFAYSYQNFSKTTDGGQTWTVISELLTEFFHFFTPTDGISIQTVGIYDYGDYRDKCNAFLLTFDGGETWEGGEASFNFRIGETFFVNENLGYSSMGFNPGTFVRLKRD